MRYNQIKTFLIVLLFAFTKAESLSYSSTDFTQSTEDIRNPDQGFYKPLLVTLGPEKCEVAEANPDQMYHIRCDISQFSKAVNKIQDLEITESALNCLDDLLLKIKSENKNAVIRFAYDPQYAGNVNKEPSMATIRTHISQLSDLLNNHKETITAIEAGMLGPWGEMHSSKLAQKEENKAEVFKYWLRYTSKFPILARTPKAIFTYFGKTLEEMEKYEIPTDDEGYRLGLFNDCFLSSSDDYYTYVFDRTRETQWLSFQNKHLPFGGETCAVNPMNDLLYSLAEMRLLKLSYLNIDYNPDVIKKWDDTEYNNSVGNDKSYFGMSGLEYIKRHLGYRLFIKSLNVNYQKYGSFDLTLKLGNEGFGNMLKNKKVDIIFTDMEDNIIKRKYYTKYKGNLALAVNGNFLAEGYSPEYKVYIRIYSSISKNVVYYPVQFANENIYNKNLQAHFLFYVKNGEIVKP